MLQRPLTHEEFVIQSILRSREAADTIVDADERTTEVDPVMPLRGETQRLPGSRSAAIPVDDGS